MHQVACLRPRQTASKAKEQTRSSSWGGVSRTSVPHQNRVPGRRNRRHVDTCHKFVGSSGATRVPSPPLSCFCIARTMLPPVVFHFCEIELLSHCAIRSVGSASMQRPPWPMIDPFDSTENNVAEDPHRDNTIESCTRDRSSSLSSQPQQQQLTHGLWHLRLTWSPSTPRHAVAFKPIVAGEPSTEGSFHCSSGPPHPDTSTTVIGGGGGVGGDGGGNGGREMPSPLSFSLPFQ